MNAVSIRNVAIVKDSSGRVVELHEIKALNDSQITAYQNEINELKAKQEQENAEQSAELLKEKQKEQDRAFVRAIVISKSCFDNIVDLGKANTNAEFEEMYEQFMLGGAFNLDIAPIEFLKIYERVK